MAHHPQNILDALPDQSGGGGGPIGPVTPGTGPTDLGKADTETFHQGDVGVSALGVVDGGNIYMPPPGDYTPHRIESTSHGSVTYTYLANTQNSENFVAPGTGINQIYLNNGFKTHSLTVIGDPGAANTWTVRLLGSIDGTHYFTLLTHTEADGDGVGVCLAFPMLVNNTLVQVDALDLGGATSINVYWMGQS